MCRVAVQASSLPGASSTWELHGAKLCGGFTLVRSGRRSADPAGEEQGLLTKHGDECAHLLNSALFSLMLILLACVGAFGTFDTLGAH